MIVLRRTTSINSDTIFLAPLPVESEAESMAGDVTPTQADPSNQAEEELANAVDAVMEEKNEEGEEEDDDADEDDEVYDQP